jgi:hypothetical protein
MMSARIPAHEPDVYHFNAPVIGIEHLNPAKAGSPDRLDDEVLSGGHKVSKRPGWVVADSDGDSVRVAVAVTSGSDPYFWYRFACHGRTVALRAAPCVAPATDQKRARGRPASQRGLT